MTQKIILIRHAKSSWDDPMADDHERVLNARGRTSADVIGKWLQANGHVPDVMLVSTAKRTVETSERLRAQLDNAPKVTFLPSLYHAAPDTILSELQKSDAATVAVIGHNPGIAFAARGLLSELPAHPRFDDYPTCATTVMTFDAFIEPGAGTLVDFTIPRDLTQ